MTHDVRQWLAEIKYLQQKLAEAAQERDEAFASAANWRGLYETEAKQRRVEANLAQQSIAALKLELQQWEAAPEEAVLASSEPDAPQLPEGVMAGRREQVNRLTSLEELREELLRTLLACDRLSRALAAEQASHAQTRRELTLALGDTVDALTRERVHRGAESRESNGHGHNGNHSPELPSAKTPLPGLPPVDPAQSRI